MNTKQKFPYLSHFLFAYFNQDWMVEFENEEMAVRTYLNEDGTENASRVVQEIDQILSLGLPEENLERVIFNDMGCCYNPESDGQSMSDWLRWVRTTMAKYAEEKMAGGK